MSKRYQAGILTASYNGLKVPNAPTIGTATAGAGSASVTFTAPSDVGGGAITSYTVISSPGSITGTGSSSPVTVSGLTNGTAYTFTVVATNAYGTGPASAASNSVTPSLNYIEEVFSTYLYTGNGSTQTITNGINLSTNGGLVWLKARSLSALHSLVDTARGAGNTLFSDATNAQEANSSVTAFNNNGFTMGSWNNTNNATHVSWTFREQAKFFDVVTYTGNGTNGRTVAHSLGSTPGCIIVKRTDAANGWAVYHRAMNASPQDYMMRLNATDGAFTTSPSRWNNTLPTSTEFTLSGNDEVNGSSATYVAYLFAHNAGGFGLTGTDNVISCGSFTTDSGGNFSEVNLGYEPQWLLIKNATTALGFTDWRIVDNMRGFTTSTDAYLAPNTSAAEASAGIARPTATGFAQDSSSVIREDTTYIYIAIRRGPMKVPTSGTSVLQTLTYTGNGSSGRIYSGVTTVPDLAIATSRSNTSPKNWCDRLRGENPMISTSTDGESGTSQEGKTIIAGSANGTVTFGSYWGDAAVNTNGYTYVNYLLSRAPSFFDEVCYTGTGTYGAANHNLGVTPELVIYKSRSNAVNWGVIKPVSSIAYYDGLLNSNSAFTYYSNDPSVAGLYTSTQFAKYQDTSSYTYVAYLFATCAGVSKVGSYTGTGTTLQVNCGFASGARFVLIKRTDSTGDWYVWDSARGIVSGNDPYLLLNSTAAEVTNTDYVDTYSAGFEISSTAPAAINASGGTFIFLAIA